MISVRPPLSSVIARSASGFTRSTEELRAERDGGGGGCGRGAGARAGGGALPGNGDGTGKVRGGPGGAEDELGGAE